MTPTEEQLRVLEQAEIVLRALGVSDVRLYGTTCTTLVGSRDRAVEALTLAEAVKSFCNPETWRPGPQAPSQPKRGRAFQGPHGILRIGDRVIRERHRYDDGNYIGRLEWCEPNGECKVLRDDGSFFYASISDMRLEAGP